MLEVARTSRVIGLRAARSPRVRTSKTEASKLGALFELCPGFMAILSGEDHQCIFANHAFRGLVGDHPMIGAPAREAFARIEGDDFFDRLDDVYRTGLAARETAAPVRAPPEPGSPDDIIYVDFTYQPMQDAGGAVSGVFIAGYDVTERVRKEERQVLLNAELNHRVKNVLATVHALTRLASRPDQSVAQFRETLSVRIHAMARTQELLVAGRFEPVQVARLLQVELMPYFGAQVELDCEAMLIDGDNAVSLGLIVHELLTNAAKYGALSNTAGRLSIKGERSSSLGTLTWIEAAGRVLGPSSTTGFGSQMIRRLARALGGAAIFDLRPEGLHATIQFSVIAPAVDHEAEG